MSHKPEKYGELLRTDESDEATDEVGNLAVFPDDGPSSGEWVDVHDVLASVTDDEAEEGRLLGEGIDPDDDDDGSEADDG